MRILMVTRGLLPVTAFGGPGTAVLQLSKELARRGHDVTIYCSNLGEQGQRTSRGTQERRLDGLRMVYLDAVFHYRFNAVTPDLVAYGRREVGTYDVVSIYGYRELMGYVTARMAHARKVPFVLQPLGNLPRYRRSVPAKWVYDVTLGRNLVGDAAAVVARSRLEEEQLRQHGIPASKLEIVPNGIDLAEFADLPPANEFRRNCGLPADAPLVLFVGRIAEIKSIELIVEAFARVGHPSAFLAIVGPISEPQYYGRLMRLVEERGLSDQVRFAGPAVGRDKLAAYVDADVTVLASRFETYGLAAAESIAAGTPVVVTDTCGIAPLVADRGGLVTRHDPEHLAGALARFLSDTDLRNELRPRLSSVAQSLSIENAASRLDEVLTKVALRRPPVGAGQAQ